MSGLETKVRIDQKIQDYLETTGELPKYAFFDFSFFRGVLQQGTVREFMTYDPDPTQSLTETQIPVSDYARYTRHFIRFENVRGFGNRVIVGRDHDAKVMVLEWEREQVETSIRRLEARKDQLNDLIQGLISESENYSDLYWGIPVKVLRRDLMGSGIPFECVEAIRDVSFEDLPDSRLELPVPIQVKIVTIISNLRHKYESLFQGRRLVHTPIQWNDSPKVESTPKLNLEAFTSKPDGKGSIVLQGDLLDHSTPESNIVRPVGSYNYCQCETPDLEHKWIKAGVGYYYCKKCRLEKL